jgi:hypothetical protein
MIRWIVCGWCLNNGGKLKAGLMRVGRRIIISKARTEVQLTWVLDIFFATVRFLIPEYYF